MYDALKEEPLEQFTFSQKTIRYRNDGQVDTSIWYEAIQYPDKFRIDFGDPAEGNAVIYRNDSAFIFRNHELQTSRLEPMPLLFLEGGMEFLPFDEVMPRLFELGLDTAEFRKTNWEGAEYYVIGAKEGDMEARQVWVDVEKLIPIRRLDPHPSGQVIELVYKDFKNFNGSMIETRVDIFIKGKLIQEEYYLDIDPDPKIPSGFFNLENFGKVHWRSN